MMRRTFVIPAILIIVLAGCVDDSVAPSARSSGAPAFAVTSDLAALGGRIFKDKNLSVRRNQSCESCHDEQWGFTAPDPVINGRGAVMPGSTGKFGTRKPPSAAYATPAPVLFFDDVDGTYVGGNFWDGHATGARLGIPAAEQSQFPFVSANEQSLPDRACVIQRIATGKYVDRWIQAFGSSIKNIAFTPEVVSACGVEGASVPVSPEVRAQVDIEYDRMATAIAAFEDSPEVNRFDAKYDAFLEGRANFSALEREGLALYEGKANCAACHPNDGAKALFTDYTYDNIGIPANLESPALAANSGFRDLGVGGFTGEASEFGKQKVPTLRNLDKRARPNLSKSFMHNGALKSLEQVVHFYNTRDVLPNCATLAKPKFAVNCWPSPEVLVNVNVDELGNLGLTDQEEKAVVAFLKTLTDGFSHK